MAHSTGEPDTKLAESEMAKSTAAPSSEPREALAARGDGTKINLPATPSPAIRREEAAPTPVRGRSLPPLDVTTPRLTYDYPKDFPQPALARVYVAYTRATRIFVKKMPAMRYALEVHAPALHWILAIFAAFSKEAHVLGAHGQWDALQFESECLKFLEALVEQARLTTCSRTSTDIRADIEHSGVWRKFRRQWSEVAKAQAVGGVSTQAAAFSGTQENSRTKDNGRPLMDVNATSRAEESAKALNSATAAKRSRAMTVAKLINELNHLKPQMFGDESEYNRLRDVYPAYLTFKIAEQRPDLKSKVLAIQGSNRHFRLAQELAGAHHGRQLSTIRDDWKDFKPTEFKRSQ